MLSGPVGFLLGSKGGGMGGEVAQTEEQFIEGYKNISASFSRCEINLQNKSLFVTLSSHGFSPEAKTGHLYLHYNLASEATGEHWSYWNIKKTMTLNTNSHSWRLAYIPDEVLGAHKYYLCIKCFETKEMINDVRISVIK